MTRSDWEILIQKHLDGQADASEVAALSARLESNAESRLLYLQLARVHSHLATDFAEEPRAGLGSELPQERNRHDLLQRRRWLVSSGVAMTLGFLVVAWLLFRSPIDTSVARLTAVSGPVQWSGDGGQVTSESLSGRSISAGTIESLSVDSWVTVEYPDRTTVTVSGRASLSVVNGPGKELRLIHGRMSVAATPQPVGQPMLIRTPTAILEVLGTQLNVASDSSSTQVFVNEGLVRLTRLVDGNVTNVPADHQAIATVDRQSELKAFRRSKPVSVWRTQFPAGVNYGDWRVATNGDSGVRAKPLLLTCVKPEPLLIYVSSASVTGTDSSPLVLSRDGQFVIRGRLGSSAEMHFGLTLNQPKGGFAGKYFAHQAVNVTEADESFEWTVPVMKLVPTDPGFLPSPIGLEIVECWCLTLHEDHDLVVESIELQLGQ